MKIKIKRKIKIRAPVHKPTKVIKSKKVYSRKRTNKGIKDEVE